MQDKTLLVPSPIINDREWHTLALLEKKYTKLKQPNKLLELGKKATKRSPRQS